MINSLFLSMLFPGDGWKGPSWDGEQLENGDNLNVVDVSAPHHLTSLLDFATDNGDDICRSPELADGNSEKQGAELNLRENGDQCTPIQDNNSLYFEG